MPASDPELCRVSVHAGSAVVDLALPAAIPVATLIPSIIDILEDQDGDGSSGLEGGRYQLSRPGTSAFNAATTLADNGIRDGAVLVLSQPATPLPAPRYHEVAEAVSATLDAVARPWRHFRPATRLTGAVAAGSLTTVGVLVLIRNAFRNNASSSAAGVSALAGVLALVFAAIAHRACRDGIAGLALGVIATEFGAVAGFLAVPGPPGTPNALLAATAAAVASVLAMRVSGCGAVTMTAISGVAGGGPGPPGTPIAGRAATAAAVASVLAMRVSGCGAVTLTAISGVAMAIAVAALVGVITAAPLRAVGSVSALLSLGLLGLAARLSIVLAGLSPRLPPGPERETIEPGGAGLAAKAIRADDWLTSLLGAFASSASAGAIITVLAGEPRLSCIAFGTVTGALLLVRARSDDRARTVVFVIGGIAVTATTFGVVALSVPERGAWIAAATAMLAAAAIFAGFVAPAIQLSPVARRGVEAVECLALIATVPLTCWICGLYGAVRGLNIT